MTCLLFSCSVMSEYYLPGSSVHGIFQAKILKWVAISFSILCDWTIIILLIVTENKIRVTELRFKTMASSLNIVILIPLTVSR